MFKFKNLSSKAQTAVMTAALSLFPFAAGATGIGSSDNLGQSVITSATSALSGLVSNVVTLVQVVMGLGAIVVLGMVIFKVFKGDREAAEKLAWWVAGLTVGFVLLTVVSNLIPTTA